MKNISVVLTKVVLITFVFVMVFRGTWKMSDVLFTPIVINYTLQD